MNKNIGDMTRSELIDYVIELQEENSGYERKIDKAIKYLESYNTDFKNCRFGEAPISIRELGDLLDILKENKWDKVERAYLDDKPIGSEKNERRN